jgi:hypothetical protein
MDGFCAFAWRVQLFGGRANPFSPIASRGVPRKYPYRLKSLGSFGPRLFRKTNCRIENKGLNEGCLPQTFFLY